MADALCGSERGDTCELHPTMLAGVFLLRASFVKRMSAFVRAIRMANAHGRSQARNSRRLVPAVLAIERSRLLRLCKGKEHQTCNYRCNNRFSHYMDFQHSDPCFTIARHVRTKKAFALRISCEALESPDRNPERNAHVCAPLRHRTRSMKFPGFTRVSA